MNKVVKQRRRAQVYTSDYSTAFHESTHAVVRVALGLEVAYIDIADDPATAGRYGIMETFDDRTGIWNWSAVLLSTLASIPAERLLRPSASILGLISSVMGGQCSDDWKHAVDIAKLIFGDDEYKKEVDRYLRKAGKLVSRLAPVIHAVATELERKRRLDRAEIMDLIPSEVKHEGMREHFSRVCPGQDPESLIEFLSVPRDEAGNPLTRGG